MNLLDGDDRQRQALDWVFSRTSTEEDQDEEECEVELDLDEEYLLLLDGLAESDEEFDPLDLDIEYIWTGDSIRGRDTEEFGSDERDRRIREYSGDSPHGVVRSYVRKRGIAEDMQDTLADLGTEVHEDVSEDPGVLDMRNTVRRMSGDTTVNELYRQPTTYPGDDIAVGVSLDMSGSMSSDETEAKAAVGSFLFSVDQLGGDVVANAWQHNSGAIQIRLLTGPTERFRWRHLDAVSPGGGDPIARGMRECGSMLHLTQADEQLLFVVTDGKPTVESLTDAPVSRPVDEAEYVAKELRQHGITVIGVGFGNVQEENLVDMFGEEYAIHVDLEDLPDVLADTLADEVLGTEVKVL